jgi:hypothetical protein
MLAFEDLEERVPAHHPLRTMKRFADVFGRCVQRDTAGASGSLIIQ